MASEYRVFNGGSDEYEIRMTYYNDDGTVSHWDDVPDFPRGTIDELASIVSGMTEALNKPVIDFDDPNQ